MAKAYAFMDAVRLAKNYNLLYIPMSCNKVVDWIASATLGDAVPNCWMATKPCLLEA
ncbi:conserved hypothetical protein [Ricinus communis]|uniref:Uncharacterized protein n=1 Tax=Ricinus communis TaxID=3988 RepID=B9SRU9_RICCO|nr:conserved hypothetical protein [Ricinus communis]